MAGGVDALIRLNVTFYLHGVNCLQSFWLRTKPTSPAGTFKAETDKACEEFRVYIWPKYQLFCTSELQFIASVATMLSPLNAAQTVEAFTTLFGTVAGEALPSHNAAVLSLYSAYPGRRVHGRLYVPAVPESQTALSVISNTHTAKLKDIGDAMLAKWGETGTSPYFWGGVYSRKNGVVRLPGPPPYLTYSPLAHVPWTRCVANSRVKTQRHRLLGRGV